MTVAELVVPESISKERTSFLIAKGIDPDIASIDLEMVKMKMAEPKEEIGWSKDQLEEAELEYKRYLVLCRRYPHPTHSIVPNKIMDTMWHYHILDTRAYCADCNRVFGTISIIFLILVCAEKTMLKNLKILLRKQKTFTKSRLANQWCAREQMIVGTIARIVAGMIVKIKFINREIRQIREKF